MASLLPIPRTERTPGPALALLLGALVGVLVGTAVSASLKWTAVATAGLLAALPALLIRPPRLYWLALYLVLLQVDLTKSVNKYFVDATFYLDTFGLPPSGDVTIVVYPSDVILAMLLAAWAFRVWAGAERPYFPRVGWIFAAFIAWSALTSLVKSEVPYLSLAELVRQLRFFAVFLYAANAIDSPRAVRGVIAILLLALTVESAITVVGFVAQTPASPLGFLLDRLSSTWEDAMGRPYIGEAAASGLRATGTFGNPVRVALYLLPLLPVAFVVLLAERGLARRALHAGLLALGLGAFVVTFSRTGLIALGLGLAVCLVLLVRRRLVPTTLALALVWTVGLGAVASAPWIYDFMTKRPENISHRLPLLRKGAIMLARNPVLGVGLDNHTVAKRRMFSEAVVSEDEYPTHNAYLTVGSETGLPGLALFVAFLGLALRGAMRHSHDDAPSVRLFSVAAAGAFAGLAVHLLGDHFSGVAQRALFYLYAGVVAAFDRPGKPPTGCTGVAQDGGSPLPASPGAGHTPFTAQPRAATGSTSPTRRLP